MRVSIFGLIFRLSLVFFTIVLLVSEPTKAQVAASKQEMPAEIDLVPWIMSLSGQQLDDLLEKNENLFQNNHQDLQNLWKSERPTAKGGVYFPAGTYENAEKERLFEWKSE